MGRVVMLTTCVIGANLLCCTVANAESAGLTIEFRRTADSETDANLLLIAQDAEGNDVYSEGHLVAKWIPVQENRALDLEQIKRLVTKVNDKGQVKVLVIVGPNDFTERNVKELRPGRDGYGNLSLEVLADKEGSLLLSKLTRENMGHPLAQIIDGQIYAVPTIRSEIYYRAAIEGPFTMDEITDMADRLNPKSGVSHSDVWDTGGLQLTLWHLFGCVAILLMVVFAALPSHGFVVHRIWPLAGMCIGSIIGTYYMGVEKCYGTADIGGGMSAIEVVYDINPVGILLGILAGGTLGLLSGYLFRRAIRNLRIRVSPVHTENPIVPTENSIRDKK